MSKQNGAKELSLSKAFAMGDAEMKTLQQQRESQCTLYWRFLNECHLSKMEL